MHWLRLAVLPVVLAAAANGSADSDATAQQPGPAAVVATLYRYHFAHEQNWDRTYQRERGLFTPALAALLGADARAAAANPDEIVGLDFDPLTNAQDEMTGFTVGTSTREGANAIVPVTVRQGSARTRLRVRLARSAAGWRVTNIEYGEGNLVSILRQLAADRARKP